MKAGSGRTKLRTRAFCRHRRRGQSWGTFPVLGGRAGCWGQGPWAEEPSARGGCCPQGPGWCVWLPASSQAGLEAGQCPGASRGHTAAWLPRWELSSKYKQKQWPLGASDACCVALRSPERKHLLSPRGAGGQHSSVRESAPGRAGTPSPQPAAGPHSPRSTRQRK